MGQRLQHYIRLFSVADDEGNRFFKAWASALLGFFNLLQSVEALEPSSNGSLTKLGTSNPRMGRLGALILIWLGILTIVQVCTYLTSYTGSITNRTISHHHNFNVE